MKGIYKIAKICTIVIPVSAGKLAIFVNMVWWFIIGSIFAFIIGVVMGESYENLIYNIETFGSIAAIIMGFIGGMIWILKNGNEET